MDELMLMEYLKSRGMDEHGFMDKFKEFMTNHNKGSHRGSLRTSFNKGHYPEGLEAYEGWDRHITGKKGYMPEYNRGGIRMERGMSDDFSGEHFIPSEAEYIVSEMYHTENGRRYTGEKYDFEKAKEVCERYRGFLPSTVNPVDVYVAINAQYHDYANLFKSWFGDRIDHKVIESAIVFWFKDEDNPGTTKLVNYFREK